MMRRSEMLKGAEHPHGCFPLILSATMFFHLPHRTEQQQLLSVHLHTDHKDQSATSFCWSRYDIFLSTLKNTLTFCHSLCLLNFAQKEKAQ